MKTRTKLLLVTSAVALLTTSVLAENDADIGALKRQIDALQTRIAALEARQTFTSFMPAFAERFHVMHRAGEAGDWAGHPTSWPR